MATTTTTATAMNGDLHSAGLSSCLHWAHSSRILACYGIITYSDIGHVILQAVSNMAAPEVRFREATLSDFRSVMAIGEQLYAGADSLEFHFRPLLHTQKVHMILAEVDGDVVRWIGVCLTQIRWHKLSVGYYNITNRWVSTRKT